MLKRESYLSRIRGFYNSDLIKILVGIRRCGKSVILRQIIDELKENGCDDEHIIFINFEYIEYEELRDYKKLNTFIKDKIIDKKRYYIFLDEIQKVEKFEEVINSLRASIDNTSIFITGSNSKLLSKELSTVLSGRYVLFNIYPLSYKEFTLLSKKNPLSEETFWNYVKWGGLPNRCEFSDDNNIRDYLHSVFDSIILRDVVDRLGLKDIFTVLNVGGGNGLGNTLKLLRSVLSINKDLQIIIINGKNKKNYNKIQKYIEKNKIENVVNLGFVNNIDKYMKACDIIISRCGGCGLSEIFAVGKPFIIRENMILNEKINKNYFINEGCALGLNKITDAGKQVKILKEDTTLYNNMVENIKKIRLAHLNGKRKETYVCKDCGNMMAMYHEEDNLDNYLDKLLPLYNK